MGRHKGRSPVGILQILVNHLTRMQPGYFCVAGVDVDTPRHIRPVLRRGRLTIDLLSTGGGPFDVGSVVDLGQATYAGYAPELEDHNFDPAHARWLFDDDPDDYWDALDGVAQESLEEIFGPELELWDDRGTVRLVLDYLMPSVDLSVNDLRLYERDGRTPRRDLVTSVEGRLKSGVEAILSVGLTRPWQKWGDTAERHWLQVNNIHLEDNPLWQLREDRRTGQAAEGSASGVARRRAR